MTETLYHSLYYIPKTKKSAWKIVSFNKYGLNKLIKELKYP